MTVGFIRPARSTVIAYIKNVRHVTLLAFTISLVCCPFSSSWAQGLQCRQLFDSKYAEASSWFEQHMVGLTQLNSQQKNVLLEFATALQNRFNQFPEHIRLYTLGENDALTDLAPFASLKGLKIEDRVLSQKGTFWGKRLFDDSRGMRWGLNVAIGIEKFKNQRVGEKHVGIHELVHLIHDYCMSVDEKQVIESLYANAKAESRFLDSYSSINSKEYFAEAVETFFAVSRNHLLVDKFYWGQTADILKEKDPALFRFISSLFDESD